MASLMSKRGDQDHQSKAGARAEREARALRENMRRRKAQAAARGVAAPRPIKNPAHGGRKLGD